MIVELIFYNPLEFVPLEQCKVFMLFDTGETFCSTYYPDGRGFSYSGFLEYVNNPFLWSYFPLENKGVCKVAFEALEDKQRRYDETYRKLLRRHFRHCMNMACIDAFDKLTDHISSLHFKPEKEDMYLELVGKETDDALNYAKKYGSEVTK